VKKRLGVARLQRMGKRFEIIVDVEKAWALRSGEKKYDIREVVEGEFVYYDVRQGTKASEADLAKVFGTSDFYKVAERIILEGDLHLTAEQRREMVEAKKKQIVEFLSKNTVDPRTGLPHPPRRIELALEQARVGIDPLKPVEAQINDVIRALQPVLPLKIARALLGIKIPPQYVGKAYGVLTRMGKVVKSNYLSDGTWVLELEVPAGIQESVIEQVNRLTRGSGEVRVIGR